MRYGPERTGREMLGAICNRPRPRLVSPAARLVALAGWSEAVPICSSGLLSKLLPLLRGDCVSSNGRFRMADPGRDVGSPRLCDALGMCTPPSGRGGRRFRGVDRGSGREKVCMYQRISSKSLDETTSDQMKSPFPSVRSAG